MNVLTGETTLNNTNSSRILPGDDRSQVAPMLEQMKTQQVTQQFLKEPVMKWREVGWGPFKYKVPYLTTDY